MSEQWPTRKTTSLRSEPGDQLVELLHIAVAPLRVAREHEAHVGETARLQHDRAASISTFWPFQAVSRAASSTTRSCGATPQASRSRATRLRSTAAGENARRSVPRGMTVSFDLANG